LLFYIYYATKTKKSQSKNHQKQEKIRILVENETQSQYKNKHIYNRRKYEKSADMPAENRSRINYALANNRKILYSLLFFALSLFVFYFSLYSLKEKI